MRKAEEEPDPEDEAIMRGPRRRWRRGHDTGSSHVATGAKSEARAIRAALSHQAHGTRLRAL